MGGGGGGGAYNMALEPGGGGGGGGGGAPGGSGGWTPGGGGTIDGVPMDGGGWEPEAEGCCGCCHGGRVAEPGLDVVVVSVREGGKLVTITVLLSAADSPNKPLITMKVPKVPKHHHFKVSKENIQVFSK